MFVFNTAMGLKARRILEIAGDNRNVTLDDSRMSYVQLLLLSATIM